MVTSIDQPRKSNAVIRGLVSASKPSWEYGMSVPMGGFHNIRHGSRNVEGCSRVQDTAASMSRSYPIGNSAYRGLVVGLACLSLAGLLQNADPE